jgi:hypothetical protein
MSEIGMCVQAGVECEVREGGDGSPSGGLDLGVSSNVTGLPDYEAMGPAEVRKPASVLFYIHTGIQRDDRKKADLPVSPLFTPRLHMFYVSPKVFRAYMSEALSFTADDTRQRRLMELGVSLISEGRSGANATTIRRGGHGPVRYY